MSDAPGRPSYALVILLGVLGLIVGPLVTAEQGWRFGATGGIETLGATLATGAAIFALGGVCLGVILNVIIRVFGKASGGDE